MIAKLILYVYRRLIIVKTSLLYMTRDGMEPPYIVLAIHRIVEEFQSYFIKIFQYELLNCHKSIDGRRLLVNIKVDDNIITIVNIYAPNDEKNRIDFFKRLKSWISQYALNDNNLLIVGDFNCILQSTDRANTLVNADRSSKCLHDLMSFLNAGTCGKW